MAWWQISMWIVAGHVACAVLAYVVMSVLA